MSILPLVSVAVPAPRRALFDYLRPAEMSLVPGVRVRVPFGSRSVVGIVVALEVQSAIAPDRLRPVTKVLDETPLLSAGLLRLLHWAADYYCHPIGEVMSAALPRALREGAPLPCGARLWGLTTAGRALLKPPGKGPLAPRLWEALCRQPTVAEEGLTPAGRAWFERWRSQGFVAAHEAPLVIPPGVPAAAPAVLNEAQRHAAAGIEALAGDPRPVLLHGVTGSGKTEVYLEAIRATLGRGLQSLVLVPEIGLTPQFVRRLECLSAPIALLHSGLSDGERARAWTAAYRGEAAIVVGTRSAVFAPLARPGLIVVDEEHDLSYKQHEGFRYHGRDLAVLRAHYERVPVVLGSATPSLESLHNAALG
ncbi:MAG: primosomal protein N' family DNA-binding protein, partial [Acidiferrobacteraceae bacterium]